MGRIWFPSGRGVVVIDPAGIPTNQVAPPVHIDRIRANGTEIARSGNTAVPPGNGELEVHFTGLSLIASQKVQYRYQLIGYDKEILGFLETLSWHFAEKKTIVGREIESLRRNLDHVKEIVDMQQSYARVAGIAETIGTDELLEDALRMSTTALARGDVRLGRDFRAAPAIAGEKHKVLQVLVNLIRNAKHACDDPAGRTRCSRCA